MEECELCGNSGQLEEYEIDGVEMLICSRCIRGMEKRKKKSPSVDISQAIGSNSPRYAYDKSRSYAYEPRTSPSNVPRPQNNRAPTSTVNSRNTTQAYQPKDMHRQSLSHTHGTVVNQQSTPLNGSGEKNTERFRGQHMIDYELLPNWTEMVKKAMVDDGWVLKDLAMELAEKQSTLHKILIGKMEPPEAIVIKLEEFFEITLRREFDKEEENQRASKYETKKHNLTLGDIATVRQRGQNN